MSTLRWYEEILHGKVGDIDDKAESLYVGDVDGKAVSLNVRMLDGDNVLDTCTGLAGGGVRLINMPGGSRWEKVESSGWDGAIDGLVEVIPKLSDGGDETWLLVALDEGLELARSDGLSDGDNDGSTEGLVVRCCVGFALGGSDGTALPVGA